MRRVLMFKYVRKGNGVWRRKELTIDQEVEEMVGPRKTLLPIKIKSADPPIYLGDKVRVAIRKGGLIAIHDSEFPTDTEYVVELVLVLTREEPALVG
jgi:hypothetical protein